MTSTAVPFLPSVTRRPIRLVAAFALAAAALVAIPAASGTAYADTPTINCDTASARATSQERTDWTTCQKLVATSQCAWNNHDGSWTIALGYKNPTSSNLFAEIPDANGNGGPNNALTATNGSAHDPDHLSTFWTGTSLTAFTVTWSPTSRQDPVTWTLMGHTFTFTERSQPACDTKPVPILGNMAAAGIGLGILMGAFLFVNRRQLARLHRAPWIHQA